MKSKLKYIVLIIILILILISAVLLIKYRSSESVKDKEKDPTSFEMDDEHFGSEYTYTYADIEKIVRSKEYSHANVNDRLDMLEPILEHMVRNGSISEYIVYMDDSPPSIKLIYEDGLGVGIQLGDFPEFQN
jgi:flagellar basal body-associated protein FliL